MTRTLRSVLAVGFVCMGVALRAGSQAAEPQDELVIEVTAVPIGAAARLVTGRSMTEAPPPLAVEGLAPARPERPGVTRRATTKAGTLQTSTTQLSKTSLSVVSYSAPALTTTTSTTPPLKTTSTPIATTTAISTTSVPVTSTSQFAYVTSTSTLKIPEKTAVASSGSLVGSVSVAPAPSLTIAPSPVFEPTIYTTMPVGDPHILVPGKVPPPSAGGASNTQDEGGTSGGGLGNWSTDQKLQAYVLLRDRVQELQQLRRERESRREEALRRQQDVQGPSALGAVNLLENLHVDRNVDLFQNDVLQVSSEVYFDANPETGIAYYMPKRYDLAWDPDDQYSMTVIYGMAGESSADGEVFMAARLQTGIEPRELEVAKSLLRAYVRRHGRSGQVRFSELRPVPLASTSDIELFGGAQNEFTISAEKVSVQRVSGFLENLDVSWATDVRRLLNIESLLRTDTGIHGSTTFQTAGAESFSRSIPLEINVTSQGSFGRLSFDRERGWRNRTPYPVTLHELHALVISPEDAGRVRKDDPVIYSWRLGDSVIPPGASVRWNAESVPAWLDGQALLMWAAYSVDGDCDACDERVFDARFIPPRPSSRTVVFTTGDVFEATGAERITVHFRSPFLDPTASRVVQRPGVRLTADGEEYTIARLFLSDREFSPAAAHEPFYEWFVEVTMRDGTTYKSADWTASRSLDFLLGSRGLEDALGGRPWEAAAAQIPAP